LRNIEPQEELGVFLGCKTIEDYIVNIKKKATQVNDYQTVKNIKKKIIKFYTFTFHFCFH